MHVGRRVSIKDRRHYARSSRLVLGIRFVHCLGLLNSPSGDWNLSFVQWLVYTNATPWRVREPVLKPILRGTNNSTKWHNDQDMCRGRTGRDVMAITFHCHTTSLHSPSASCIFMPADVAISASSDVDVIMNECTRAGCSAQSGDNTDNFLLFGYKERDLIRPKGGKGTTDSGTLSSVFAACH